MTQQLTDETQRLRGARDGRTIFDIVVATKYIGYGVSLISFSVGIAFVTGVFVPSNIPLQFRVMCGVVFLLLGIYRFVATKFKAEEEERSNR